MKYMSKEAARLLFNEHINGLWAGVDVCGVRVPSSTALLRIDATRYEKKLQDWLDERGIDIQ